jgi:hypothetical protein
MTDPMLLPPDLTEYRWGLYARGHFLDLANKPGPPLALYRDEVLANSHGARLWPSTYLVVDLHKDDRP